jgi:hypothetical protein
MGKKEGGPETVIFHLPFSPAVPVWALFFAGRRMSPAIGMMPVARLIVVSQIP